MILVHVFCNWSGFPRFWGRVGGETVLGPDCGEEGEGDDGGWGWTVVYYFLLVVGAVGWWKLLWVWTESEGALVRF